MKSLRQLCLESPRLYEIDYASFKKEIGAIEIHGMEQYFNSLIALNTPIHNNCNSIVAYLLGITNEPPDGPLVYKGGTNPDVDVDVPRHRREDVLNYLRRKYGAGKVANIGTYSFMHAKSGIRKVGKALGYDFNFVSDIAKMVPDPVQGVNWTVETALEASKELRAARDNDIQVAEVLFWTSRLEGVIDSRGQHAAGVVVADHNITDIAPMWQRQGSWCLEFDGNEVESLGFVKLDLLGLKTLDVIDDALTLINERHKTNYILDEIPLDDSDTFSSLGTGNLLSVFQLEASGISGFTKELKPKTFMDISLILAGYRPGPMRFISSILAVKKGSEPEVVPHSTRYPILKEILNETYGFFIYQEQIINVAKLIAGYNDQEANDLLNIIRKKKLKEIPKAKEIFFPKAKEKGLSDLETESLWSEMEDFASYSFNKSHSVAYSFLTYYTAWIKAHYPAEFYATNIKHELSDIIKVTNLIREANSIGIKITPPDINDSEELFTIVTDNEIRYGLSGIVGAGESATKPIIEERKSNGKFKSVSDFIVRVNPKSNVIANMIKAGCFDRFAKRSQLLLTVDEKKDKQFIDKLLDTIKYYKDKSWILDDYAEEMIPLPVELEFSLAELIQMEKEVTNLWLSGHPLDIYEAEIEAFKQGSANKHVGFIDEFRMFKNKTGLFFHMNGKRFSMFKKSWDKYKKAGSFEDQFMQQLVSVESWTLRDGDLGADKIGVFNTAASVTAGKVNLPITLDNKGLQYLQKYGYLKSKISNQPQEHFLTLQIIGDRLSYDIPVGYVAT